MLTHLTIKARLNLNLFLMAFFLLAVGASGLFGMKNTDEGLRAVYEGGTLSIQELARVEELSLKNRLAIAVAMKTPTSEIIANSAAEIEHNIAESAKVWDSFMAREHSAEAKGLIDTLAAARAAYRAEALTPAISALRENNIERAETILVDKIRPMYKTVIEAQEAVVAYYVDYTRNEFVQAKKLDEVAQRVIVGTIIVALALAAWSCFGLFRAIARPLESAVKLAESVAQGDLTQRIEAHSNDEFGNFLKSMKRMNEALANIVGQVRTGSESIAVASREIASGNSDLSSRTESQASSLEETASSMEELTSTVRQNADNARQANQLVSSTADVAVKGGQVVNQVVDTMASIKESSRKIADIIGVIDGIAFQTNILALNAAVEAARAGEQGKGFAVVAAEVRNLAQRSAAAAKEIKSLIEDSVGKVEAGGELVDEAGKTMDEIVSSVKRVTDIMSEIAAASLEQSDGIEQVNQAVGQMDEMTQQNAALVEQAAAASESLQEQAGKLAEAVSVFKLDGMGHAAAVEVKPSRGKVTPMPRAKPKAKAMPAMSAPVAKPNKVAVAGGGNDEWEEF